MPQNRAKIVSFSGIDGAGKTTQISALESWLREMGLTTKLFTFWDDVAVASHFRETMSHVAFKGDKGVGSPEKPLERRDKNVTSGPVVAARFLFYLADAVSLCRKVAVAKKSGVDVVIFDRYIYDELANLSQNRLWARAFIGLVLKFVSKPDIAYFIDADPEAARARKPEYPLGFLRKNREAYLALAKFSGAITVIGPAGIDKAKTRVREAFLQIISEPPEVQPALDPAMKLQNSSLQ